MKVSTSFLKPIAHSLILAVLTGTALGQSATVNWPQFRGADSRGIGEGKNLPESWSTTRNVAWKTEIPGYGWSSPIVWGDRVFVTTVVNEGQTETPKKGLYFGGERKEPAKDTHQWKVLCLDFATGKLRWEREVHAGPPVNRLHVKNTYASETPVTDGERVYAYFGNVGLFCLDMDGKPQWSTKWPPVKTRYGWGHAASPVLHKDRIYVVNDNDEKSFLVALDTRTGSEVWRVERDEKSNWATPFVWQNEKRTELITPGTKRIRSYDLAGKPLWELGGMSTITITTPFASHGLLYVCSGYVGDKTKPIFAIKPGASGDISLKDDEDSNPFIAWRNNAGPYNPSPVLLGDYFYVLYDQGFLACYDARTGREVYGKQRLNASGISAFTSSIWAYNGKVFCLSEDGDTYVVTAGREFKLIGKNSLDEMCMATPAIARDSVFIRTASKLYCIRKQP
jgi:outer membrane protein assembly factor BamB